MDTKAVTFQPVMLPVIWLAAVEQVKPADVTLGWQSGIGSDVMKSIDATIVGGMITSTIQVLILVPVFSVMMKERALRKGHLHKNPLGR